MTWEDVLEKVGEDVVATLTYLFADELAQLVGLRAKTADPAEIMEALIEEGFADDEGRIHKEIGDYAEEGAMLRAIQEYPQLEEISWEDMPKAVNLFYELAGKKSPYLKEE